MVISTSPAMFYHTVTHPNQQRAFFFRAKDSMLAIPKAPSSQYWPFCASPESTCARTASLNASFHSTQFTRQHKPWPITVAIRPFYQSKQRMHWGFSVYRRDFWSKPPYEHSPEACATYVIQEDKDPPTTILGVSPHYQSGQGCRLFVFYIKA
jgi:hypothetical protein